MSAWEAIKTLAVPVFSLLTVVAVSWIGAYKEIVRLRLQLATERRHKEIDELRDFYVVSLSALDSWLDAAFLLRNGLKAAPGVGGQNLPELAQHVRDARQAFSHANYRLMLRERDAEARSRTKELVLKVVRLGDNVTTNADDDAVTRLRDEIMGDAGRLHTWLAFQRLRDDYKTRLPEPINQDVSAEAGERS